MADIVPYQFVTARPVEVRQWPADLQCLRVHLPATAGERLGHSGYLGRGYPTTRTVTGGIDTHREVHVAWGPTGRA